MSDRAVQLLLFAALRDAAGNDRVTITLDGPVTAGCFLETVEQQVPALRGRLAGVRVAVNQEFVFADTPVDPGAEVALIPPVSGGSTVTPPTIITLVHEPIVSDRIVPEVTTPGCGATVTFLGVVRDHHHGQSVLRLEYSAYDAMAISEMQHIAATVRERWPVIGVAIVHRLGTLEVGESSILIALSLAHRKDGFAALEYAIDTFKERVPIWKREFFADGTAEWVQGS